MAEEKFEEALSKLEDIVRKMEQGDMTLEESLKAFEEGIRLSRLCARKLDETEKRVNLLIKIDDGFDVKPFEAEGENDSQQK
jgi:exodeoxyribonuclease VII small subunit